MEKKDGTYSEALMTLWKGTRQLSGCLGATFVVMVLDTVKFVMRHYIMTVVMTAVFVMMFVKMSHAITERDSMNVRVYQLEQSCDSLKLLVRR